MFKIINKSSYPGNECYEHLAEMCRRATAKDLRGPDERLKQAIVHAINNNSAQATIPPKIVTEILVRRLQMDKPHKQYLAVDLVRKVLADCTDKMRMYRPELLNEIGKISFKAGKNGSVEAQRAAKKAAIDYLMSQGPEGQHALMMAGNGHDANLAQFTTVPRPMPMVYSPTAASGGQLSSPQSTRGTTAQTDFMPTGDTIEDVKQLIELANGHSEVLEELITASRELQGESNPLIKELLDKVTALKQVFPGLLEKLSQIGTPEAEGIMAQALQASDVLDNCLELQSSVRSARQNASARATPTGTPKASSPQANSGTSAAPPAAEPAAAAAPAAAPAPPPEPKQEIDLLGFDSLASPPKASTTAAAPPANDPFGFMDLTLQDPKAAANGSAAPAAQPPSGNPFEAAAPEAPPTSMPANPFAMPAPAAAPAAAPYDGTAPSYGQQPPPPYGAPPQAANPFGSDMFAGGMANPFQQNSTGFPPAQPPYSQPGPAPGYPQQPLPHNQLPGYMPQQTGMPGYPSAGPPNMAPYGYASPGQAPPMPMYNGNAPSQVAPVQMFNGGFPSPMQPPNPFLPQMPGLPQQASYVPPAKKYTNAFDDLLSDVSARPKSAATPPPMTAPMAKTLASKKAAAAPPAAAALQHVPAPAAPAPAAADPFDLLVAQNAPAHAVANPNMSSEFDALVGR